MIVRRAAGAVVLVALSLPVAWSVVTPAGAAPAHPDKTIPTLPPTGAVAGGEAISGIGIPAAAELPQLVPVVAEIVGVTADVAGELASLADVPAGIRSPNGSSVREVTITYVGAIDAYLATITFTTDATPDDTVVFYQASMTAAGFVPVADSGDFDSTVGRLLRFDNLYSAVDDAAVEVAVRDTRPTEVDLVINDAVDERALQAFTGWAKGLPTLEQAEPVEATLTVTQPSPATALTISLSTTFAHRGMTPDDLAAALRSGLPDGGFSLADDDDGGLRVSVEHAVLEDVGISIATDQADVTHLVVDGTLTLVL